MRITTVDPGLLIHEVVWSTATITYDSLNQQVETWADSGSIFAYVEPLSGRELWYAQQVNALVNYRVTLRNSYAVKPKDRIKWGSSILAVASVIPVEGRSEMLRLDCTQVVT